MNRSGKAVKAIAEDYKIAPEDIWVIHDDLDLFLGTLRISRNGSSGGHKGVQSIIDELGTKGFIRFRIGIALPKSGANKCELHANNTGWSDTQKGVTRRDAERFVLGKFTPSEDRIIKKMIKKAAQAVEVALEQGIEAAMNKFN